MITKLRSLVALGTLATSVAGYFGYDRYFSKPAPDASEVAGTGDSSDVEPADFKTADSKERGPSDSLLDGQDGDPFETSGTSEIDQDPQAPAQSVPRKMRHVPNAAPIAANHGAGNRSPKMPPKKPSGNRFSIDDESLAIDDDSDDSAPPKMTQSEPALDDELSGPSLDTSGSASRRNAVQGRVATHPHNAANRAREFSGGPRITSNETRDDELSNDLSDDRLDGYNVAKSRHNKTAHGTAGRPRVSVIDVRDESEADERFEGYVPENPTSRRAVSKTTVIRPTEATAQRSPAAGINGTGSRRSTANRDSLDDDDFLDEAPRAPQAGRGNNDLSIDDESEINRPSHNGVTPIRRRGSPPVPSAGNEFKARRQPADDFSQDREAAGDVYRVMPDDNFWKISRKQYGTARYFQALTRHNQDRVPDPQKLRPGTEISTPPVALLERRYPDLIEKVPPVLAGSGLAENKGARPRFEKPVAAGTFDDLSDRRTESESTTGYFYNKSGEPMYRVGSDDTLTSIAQRHLGRASRWTEIYDQNRNILKSPNDLTLGTVIRLPEDASRLSLVPEGERRR